MVESALAIASSARAGAKAALPGRLPDPEGGALNLVVLGGSSARGYPYETRVSIGQVVAWRLAQATGRPVVTEILAEGGANLEGQRAALAGLRHRPDAVIVYAGHNEFWTRVPWSRRWRPATGWFDRFRRASRLAGLIDAAIDGNQIDAPPPPRGRPPAIDRPACSPAEFAEVVRRFRRDLEAIVAFCRRQGAHAILVIPPSNDAGWEPNRSVLPAGAGDAEGVEAERGLAEAGGERDPGRAERRYRALIARWPTLAEAHYRLGRLLAAAGREREANAALAAARDLDGFLYRCPTAIQEVYRGVAAAGGPGVVLIDGPAVLRATSPSGRLDYHVFHDAHHPSFVGHAALAEAVLTALAARGWPRRFDPAVDRAACADRFAIDADAWLRACSWAASAHQFAARERHDPTVRLAWADRFIGAAARIRAGAEPGQAGVPGLGVTPIADAEATRRSPELGENAQDLRTRRSRAETGANVGPGRRDGPGSAPCHAARGDRAAPGEAVARSGRFLERRIVHERGDRGDDG
jgi:hypothetical protein